MCARREAQVFQGPRPRDGSWPQGGQSVLDEKRSFARHLELASDAGRKVSRSSGGTFANDHAVGKLRILRTLSGNRNGLATRAALPCPGTLDFLAPSINYNSCRDVVQLYSVRGIVTPLRACGPSGGSVAKGMKKISYRGYGFPPEIIQQAIWLYLRFTLSLRDVEDLLAERGIMVSYETVRRWVNHFGPMIAANLTQT